MNAERNAPRDAVTDSIQERGGDLHPLSPEHARLHPLPVVVDERGELLPLDFRRLPFVPCRAFLVRHVPSGRARGGHAHLHARQLMVCAAGEVDVEIRYAGLSARVTLRLDGNALLVEPGVWARQVYGAGAALLVLASHPYDPAGYVDQAG